MRLQQRRCFLGRQRCPSDRPAFEAHLEYVRACLSLEERLEDQAQQLYLVLSALKLSNAQGQRLLKLTGATWLVAQLDKCESCEPPSEQRASSFAPDLSDVPLFRSHLGATKACSALLDFVGIPKAAMKRSRATDLLAAYLSRELSLGGSAAQSVSDAASADATSSELSMALWMPSHSERATDTRSAV